MVSSLNRLNISGNVAVNSAGLSYLAHLENLTQLDISWCKLDDDAMLAVSKIRSLKKVDIHCNFNLTYLGMHHLTNIKDLEVCRGHYLVRYWETGRRAKKKPDAEQSGTSPTHRCQTRVTCKQNATIELTHCSVSALEIKVDHFLQILIFSHKFVFLFRVNFF